MGKNSFRKISIGTATSFSGAVLGKICMFIFTFILSHKLSPYEVGLYFLSVSIITIYSSISILGLEPALVRYIAIIKFEENGENYSGTILTAFIICSAMCILVLTSTYFLNPFICAIYREPELEFLVRLLSAAIPFEVFRRLILAVTRGLKKMVYTAFIEDFIIFFLRMLMGWFLLTFTSFGLKGVILAYLGSSILSFFVSLIACRKYIKIFNRPGNVYCFKKLLNFSFPMALTALMFSYLRELDSLLIGWLGSIDMVGIYSIIIRLLNSFKFIFLAFQRSISPYISELEKAGKKDELRILVIRSLKWNIILNIPICLLITAFPGFFLSLFGVEYIPGYSCLALLAIANLFSALSGFSSSLIFMSGRSGLSFMINFLWLILIAVFDIAFIPRFGLLGVAISASLSLTLVSAIRVFVTTHCIGINPLAFSYLKPIVAGVATFVSAVMIFGWNKMLHHGEFILCLLFFSIVYFSLVFFLVLDKSERITIKAFLIPSWTLNRLRE